MDFAYKTYFKTAPNTGYETLIYDCMIGDATLFQRADNIEAGWQAVQPILDAWANNAAEDFPNYVAGGSGPTPRPNCWRATGARGGRSAVEHAVGRGNPMEIRAEIAQKLLVSHSALAFLSLFGATSRILGRGPPAMSDSHGIQCGFLYAAKLHVVLQSISTIWPEPARPLLLLDAGGELSRRPREERSPLAWKSSATSSTQGQIETVNKGRRLEWLRDCPDTSANSDFKRGHLSRN